MNEYKNAIITGEEILQASTDSVYGCLRLLENIHTETNISNARHTADNSVGDFMFAYVDGLLKSSKIRTSIIENLTTAIEEIEILIRDTQPPEGVVLKHSDYIEMLDKLTEKQVTLMKRMRIQCRLLDTEITSRMTRLENSREKSARLDSVV